MEGNVTAQDFTRGVELLKLSAGQGFPLAIAKLGHAYVLGQGVPMNRPEGMRLLHEASDLGDGFAAPRFSPKQNESGSTDPSSALRKRPSGHDDAGSRLDPTSSGHLFNHGHRSGRKELDKRADPGDVVVQRQAFSQTRLLTVINFM